MTFKTMADHFRKRPFWPFFIKDLSVVFVIVGVDVPNSFFVTLSYNRQRKKS